MCSFGSCQMRFEFLSQFRKVRNAFECFVTQVQTRLPKTKRVWPMKINVTCTVILRSFGDIITNTGIKLSSVHIFYDKTYWQYYCNAKIVQIHKYIFVSKLVILLCKIRWNNYQYR